MSNQDIKYPHYFKSVSHLKTWARPKAEFDKNFELAF